MAKSNWSRESRQSRGYGASWDKIRLQVLRRDNRLCQCARCKGGLIRVTPASEVHHIKSRADGGTEDPSNLQAIAHDCHERETIEARGDKVRPIIGMDGFPLADQSTPRHGRRRQAIR